jgi:hypothetical protein
MACREDRHESALILYTVARDEITMSARSTGWVNNGSIQGQLTWSPSLERQSFCVEWNSLAIIKCCQ